MTYMIHNFAFNLSRLRKEKGISQTELAEKQVLQISLKMVN